MNQDYYDMRNVVFNYRPKYTAKNKKGKESKTWETQYKNIWNGKKR